MDKLVDRTKFVSQNSSNVEDKSNRNLTLNSDANLILDDVKAKLADLVENVAQSSDVEAIVSTHSHATNSSIQISKSYPSNAILPSPIKLNAKIDASSNQLPDNSSNKSTTESSDITAIMNSISKPTIPSSVVIASFPVSKSMDSVENSKRDEPSTSKLTPLAKPAPTPAISKDSIVGDKKKDDEKLGMYKALAIKLKKELVKCRDELQKLKQDSQTECRRLEDEAKNLQVSLESERQTNFNLETKVKVLKQQVDSLENDLQLLHNDFENYKTRASQILHSNNGLMSKNLNNTFEEERYKQLKELNQEQQRRMGNLEKQLSSMMEKNMELEEKSKLAQERLNLMQNELNLSKNFENKCNNLIRENENLKIALKQFRSKLKEPNCDVKANISTATNGNHSTTHNSGETIIRSDSSGEVSETNLIKPEVIGRDDENVPFTSSTTNTISVTGRSTPVSLTDDLDRFGLSEFSSTTPTNSRLNQGNGISKTTDSDQIKLLNDQVAALRGEMERLKRSTERMDLVENLEYLKNVVFKFLTLDSGQNEQKQRLIPVLSTVLKLTPEETIKLQSLTQVDKLGIASSFFKL